MCPNKRAFSLVEMQLSLAISAILVLTIGWLSQISMKAEFTKRGKAQLFYDLRSAILTAEQHIRSSGTLSESAAANPWLSEQVIFDAGRIGIQANPYGAGRQLVYLDAANKRNVLLAMPDNNLDFSVTLDCSPICTKAVLTIEGKKILNSSGSNWEYPFEIVNVITRRVS